MDRYDLALKWVDLSLDDAKVVSRLDIDENRGAIVYHLQQFVEKILKSVIAVLGFDPPKTHFPSKELESILFGVKLGELNLGIEIDEHAENILFSIINVARSLEDEVTRPRYGVRHAHKIILPNELYTRDSVLLFIDDAEFVARGVLDLYTKLNVCKKKIEICKKIERGIEYVRSCKRDH